MPRNLIPMLHVPDVPAAAAWYESILGFSVVGTHEDDWAMLAFGDGRVMFSEGMREIIVRDLNRFWITFGQSLTAS